MTPEEKLRLTLELATRNLENTNRALQLGTIIWFCTSVGAEAERIKKEEGVSDSKALQTAFSAAFIDATVEVGELNKAILVASKLAEDLESELERK